VFSSLPPQKDHVPENVEVSLRKPNIIFPVDFDKNTVPNAVIKL